MDGITCQKWTSFYPQKHNLLPAGFTGKRHQDGLGDHNFCRNPTGQRRNRPWCFVTKSLKSKQTWQYCDVRACTKKRSPNDIPESNSQDTRKQTSKRDTSKTKNKRKKRDKQNNKNKRKKKDKLDNKNKRTDKSSNNKNTIINKNSKNRNKQTSKSRRKTVV